MALIKDTETKCGNTANYHVFNIVKKYVVKRTVYKDKAFRLSGGRGVTLSDIRLPPTVLTEDNLKVEGKTELVLAYEYVKHNHDEYVNAEDDL